YTNPDKIVLKWPDPATIGTSYSIYRKQVGGTAWGSPIAVLADTANSYTDVNVTAGNLYEYKIRKVGGGNSTSYVAAGIEHRVVEAPRTLLLLIDSTFLFSLTTEIDRLKTDIELEGWNVTIRYVEPTTTPPQVKSYIQAEANADPDLTTV